MWRRGTATATANEGLTFAYSTNATSLTVGTFVAAPALNFSSPGDACSTTQNVAVNGNSANCRQLISATISGLVIPNGQSFWIRWTDLDTAGSDDGVGVDDFSVAVTTSALSISPTATGAASPGAPSPGQPVLLSGTITPGQNPTSVSFAVSCDLSSIGGSTAQSLPVSNTSFSLSTTIDAHTLPNNYTLGCTVIDDQGRFTHFSITLVVLIPLDATCGATATPIHAVQGSGATSALVGQVVDLEGIVVGAFQGAAQLNGFYLEEPMETQDGDPQTSEGIFVFASAPVATPGDRVRIRGTVAARLQPDRTWFHLKRHGVQRRQRVASAYDDCAARRQCVGLRTV
jgi:hypothetical protein